MSALFRVLQQRFNPPKDNIDSKVFNGRTVLITGATTGLGLEAAKKVVAKGARRLIITARDVQRGENAKLVLQSTAKAASSNTEIDVLSLDMSSFAGVKSFLSDLKTKYTGLDTAILNAGTLQTKWTKGVEGYEEIIQVNTLSTVLLALLLLPSLEKSSTLKQPAHLTFVSSGTALAVKAADFTRFADTEVIGSMSDEKGWSGGQVQYARSKLLLEYAMRRIAKLPQLRSSAGVVKVVVNSTCPGMCKSDLGRQFKTNILMVCVIWLFFTLARTTEQGSRIYVSAVNQGAESQGQIWKDDKFYKGGEMIGTSQGEKLGDKTWKELVEVLEKADSSVKAVLGSE